MSAIIDRVLGRTQAVEHTPKYLSYENDSIQIECSCGWKSDNLAGDEFAFGVGGNARKLDVQFEEHKALATVQAETTMEDSARERAVTPAQNPKSKKPRR